MSSLQFLVANRVNLFFLIFAILWTCHEAVRDTLKPGDTLNSSSFLVSAKGKFTLGFYVSDQNSNSSYLAIWQNYLTTRQKGSVNHAWIANRCAPILYPSGVLTLDMNKTLKIMHKGGDPMVLYPANSEPTSINSTSSVVATLLDSGNFIMQEVNSDGSMKRVLWESFDYPTNTLLPGMKVGVNHRNGHIWLVSSWSSFYLPVPGPFTLDWDPKGRELKIKRRGVVYWTSGIFRDGRFEFMNPDDELRTVGYKFSIVSNENEDYFTYTSTSVNQSYVLEWVLNVFGILRELGGNVIASADNCYGYNTDGGCQGRDYPSCRHIGDTFVQKSGLFNPTTPNLTLKRDENPSLTTSDCKAACWDDCDCHGFRVHFDNQTGCEFWIGNWTFISKDLFGNPSIFILSEFSRSDTNSSDITNKASHTKRWIWIGTSIATALLVMVFCILCYLLRRRGSPLSGKGQKKIANELLDLMQSDKSLDVNGLKTDGKVGHNDLRVFSYASVLVATSNFSEQNKLGEGGFGPVYRGKMAKGRDIAVKRLSRCSGQGTLEFKNELTLISELQHTNLVQLLGYCIHGEERMLIYEYMQNKSLDHFLFDSTRGILLDWNKRFSIIEGITQGLLYLHKYSRVRVIHRDLKASNILLDENMIPKISDFGMARIFTHNELEANTNRVVGTYGYMSPEYAMEGIFSIKSDIYSFGVIMLEIISGRINHSFYIEDHTLNIVGYAWELWKEGHGLELMDPTLRSSCIEDQLLRCIHVGLLCVEEKAVDRPTMSDVVSMLTNESMSLPTPTKPAFCIGRIDVRAGIDGKISEIISVNSMSNSEFEAR